MKTSYYAVTPMASGTISISRSMPAGSAHKHYPKLAPSQQLLWAYKNTDMNQRDYQDWFYEETLGPLNPQQIWDELHDLASGAEPVLLCYEAIKGDLLTVPAIDLPRKNFCHRRIIAEWFDEWLGKTVDEVGQKQTVVQPVLFGAQGDRA